MWQIKCWLICAFLIPSLICIFQVKVLIQAKCPPLCLFSSCSLRWSINLLLISLFKSDAFIEDETRRAVAALNRDDSLSLNIHSRVVHIHYTWRWVKWSQVERGVNWIIHSLTCSSSSSCVFTITEVNKQTTVHHTHNHPAAVGSVYRLSG